MAARSIGSGTISFGLVSIPVRLYVATSSESLSFNMLHEPCRSRIKQQLFCPTCERVVERSEIVQVLQQGQEVLTSTWFIVTATILLVLAAAYAILAILMNRKNKKVRRVKKYRDL